MGTPGHPPPLPPLFPLPQPKLTPQEKLKLRMQKALNRQCMYPSVPQVCLAPPPSSLAFGEEWVCTLLCCHHAKGLGRLVDHLNLEAYQATVSLSPTVKADKKAAQEKMIQQEHERQVRVK